MVKNFFKTFFWFFRRPIDLAFSVSVLPAAYLLLLYRLIGSSRLPKTTKRLKHIGIFPVRDHYYEPLFNHKHLLHPLGKNRELPGLDLNVNQQLCFLSSFTCADELVELNLTEPAKVDTDFTFSIKSNGSFGAGDADFLYQFIRKVKPKKLSKLEVVIQLKLRDWLLIKT